VGKFIVLNVYAENKGVNTTLGNQTTKHKIQIKQEKSNNKNLSADASESESRMSVEKNQ
jgi:hypothetical protein